MAPRRRLLFISPVMPAAAGNGLAMRAGAFLAALAEDHEVSLLVVPVAGAADPASIPDFVRRHAAQVAVLPLDACIDTHYRLIARLRDPAARARALAEYPRPALGRAASPHAVARAAAQLGDRPYDVVHVFRLYMAPFAAPFLAAARRRKDAAGVLDMDDDEPRTHGRIAHVHRLRGEVDAAMVEAAEAEKYARMEREWLSRFARVIVCSDGDREALGRRHAGVRLAVVPNAVRAPAAAACERAPRCFSVVFVGSFGYFPNEDAALVFGEAVWPRIAAASPRPARAWLVGSGPGPAVRALDRTPGIAVMGPVADVAPYYARADVAVNPVRAGGGTRIKAIEAFAHGVPLVSTAIGAEGLDAEDGRHLLIADEPEAFAQACLRLARDPSLGARLAAEAGALYRARYGIEAVTARIRALYQGLAVDAPE